AAGLAATLPPGAGKSAHNSLVLAMPLEPPHLDPTAGAAAAIKEVTYHNVFESLTRIDRDGNVVPGLAESWSVSDDGRVYTFKLRQDVRFHDGAPMTSADVKFSFDRARGPDSVNAQKALYAGIADVATPDPYTAVITLAEPDGLFLFNAALGDASIVS